MQELAPGMRNILPFLIRDAKSCIDCHVLMIRSIIIAFVITNNYCLPCSPQYQDHISMFMPCISLHAIPPPPPVSFVGTYIFYILSLQLIWWDSFRRHASLRKLFNSNSNIHHCELRQPSYSK